MGSAPPHSLRAHDSTTQVTISQALEIWSEGTVVPETEVVETGENENAENTAVELNPSITQLEDKTRNSTLALSQEASTTISQSLRDSTIYI